MNRFVRHRKSKRAFQVTASSYTLMPTITGWPTISVDSLEDYEQPVRVGELWICDGAPLRVSKLPGSTVTYWDYGRGTEHTSQLDVFLAVCTLADVDQPLSSDGTVIEKGDRLVRDKNGETLVVTSTGTDGIYAEAVRGKSRVFLKHGTCRHYTISPPVWTDANDVELHVGDHLISKDQNVKSEVVVTSLGSRLELKWIRAAGLAPEWEHPGYGSLEEFHATSWRRKPMTTFDDLKPGDRFRAANDIHGLKVDKRLYYSFGLGCLIVACDSWEVIHSS